MMTAGQRVSACTLCVCVFFECGSVCIHVAIFIPKPQEIAQTDFLKASVCVCLCLRFTLR